MKAIADATDREAWVEARRGFLGASDVSAVLGINPWATPLDVWAEKTGLVGPKEQTLAMTLGHELEDLAARLWTEQHGRSDTWVLNDPTTYAHDDHPWLAMTPDRAVIQRADSGFAVARLADALHLAVGLLECKWVGPRVADNWRDDDRNPVVPVYVRTQCQVQMAVSGLPWVDVCAILGDGPHYLTQRVERDQADIDWIIDYCGAWWARHVVGGERPDDMLGRPDKVQRSLERIYPTGDGAVRLPAEAAPLIDELKRAKALHKDLGDDVKRIENRLRAKLGEASEGFLDDNAKPAVTWREQTRKGHDLSLIFEHSVDEMGHHPLGCTAEELAIARRLVAACETVSRFRVLRVS